VKPDRAGIRRLVTVALANKLARILWAMMKTGESFRTEMFAKA
jgi:transposase